MHISDEGFIGGGYTGNGERVGIIHPGHVFLPRAAYDRLGDEVVRKLAGPNAEVIIIEPDEDAL